MPEVEIKRRLGVQRWDANKRTIARTRRVDEDVLDRAAALKEQGRFAEAADLLKAQPEEALAGDAVALNGLGHFLFGEGKLAEALASYEAAEHAACRDMAKALINQATVLKSQKRYDDAFEVARRARDLQPDWFVPYLTLIAIHEWRAQAADRNAAEEWCKALTENCAGWAENAELWRFLLRDVDYARLRSTTIFTAIFGTSAEEANRRFGYAG